MTTETTIGGMQPRTSAPAGWPVVGWCAFGLLVIATAVLAANGSGEAGLRTLIRVSALTSLLLFSGAFTASAFNRLLRAPVSRWLLANRRYLGVSFALSHTVHLVPIIVLASTVSDFRANPTTLVFGGIGYVVLAAMTATSFDRTAAWLGPRAWKRLHRFGVYYLWFIFAASYLPRVASSRWYLFHSGVLMAALALRLYGRAKA
ncbi:MAG TPA: hypothetical protein VL403_05570 [Candidatus Kryptonia bacterium]|nr:hypothetical protein [Candidatus Kryptonia bacterium]